jgi:hypothetical protein
MAQYHSPIICNTTLRSLCLVSISNSTTCCHTPSNRVPSLNGMVKLGPTRDARTCECPFPSFHVLSCSYSILRGTILFNIFGKSIRRPGSYSMVVIAAVDPETKTVTIPSLRLLSLIAFDTGSVISMTSFSPPDLI